MKLRDYLKQHGLTQAEFGLTLNPPISQMNLSHVMTGRTRISLERAIEIERATGGEVPAVEWVTPPSLVEKHVP